MVTVIAIEKKPFRIQLTILHLSILASTINIIMKKVNKINPNLVNQTQRNTTA